MVCFITIIKGFSGVFNTGDFGSNGEKVWRAKDAKTLLVNFPYLLVGDKIFLLLERITIISINLYKLNSSKFL